MATASTLVLVVDDEKELVAAIRDSLPSEFFTVLTAYSGEEALTILDSQVKGGTPVECIVSDWMMPGMDGLALLAQVRTRSQVDAAFLLMSGAVTREKLLAVARHGPDAVILKPFKADDLVAKIQEAGTARTLRRIGKS